MAKPVGATPGGDLMPTSLAFNIIGQLAAAGVRSITWTGGGEPTLHPDFDEIIRYAHEGGAAFTDYPEGERSDRRWRRVEQGIYTHGGHISDARAALLKRAMTFVYVSLDAGDPVSYKEHKGVDRFDQVIRGVKRLVAAEGEATIGLGFLLTADTWKDWPRMVALAKSLNVDYCQFRPTILYDEKDPSSKADSTEWMKEACVELAHLQGEPGVVVDLDRLKMYDEWTGHGYTTCYWSALQAVITPNGKLWTCVNKREYADAEIGDLTTHGFKEVWADHQPCQVGPSCRVMCRGHLPNLALNEIMRPVEHGAFI